MLGSLHVIGGDSAQKRPGTGNGCRGRRSRDVAFEELGACSAARRPVGKTRGCWTPGSSTRVSGPGMLQKNINSSTIQSQKMSWLALQASRSPSEEKEEEEDLCSMILWPREQNSLGEDGVCECERERVRAFAWERESACLCVCSCECVRLRMCERMRALG